MRDEPTQGMSRLGSGRMVTVQVPKWLAAALDDLKYVTDSPPVALAKLLADPDVDKALRRAVARLSMEHRRAKADRLRAELFTAEAELAVLEKEIAA